MHPTEAQFMEIARRYIAVAAQVAVAFEQGQAGLQLESVLSPLRLSSAAGTQESLTALHGLSDLVRAHKQAFEKFVVTFSAELAAVTASLPQDIADSHRAGLIASLNWQLDAQGRFYAGRERWIAAAADICHLLNARRETAHFSPEGVSFADDEDNDRFDALLAVIEEVHQQEVVLLGERTDRLARAAATLGLRASP
jgi:hypothetical protein